MRRLTEHERIALEEIGEPGEGPIPDAVFQECIRMGWGRWIAEAEQDAPPGEWSGFVWQVTEAGRRALALDDGGALLPGGGS